MEQIKFVFRLESKLFFIFYVEKTSKTIKVGLEIEVSVQLFSNQYALIKLTLNSLVTNDEDCSFNF